MKQTMSVPCTNNEITIMVDSINYQYLALRRASLDVAPLEQVNVTLTDEDVDGHAYYEVAGFSVAQKAQLASVDLVPGDYVVYRAVPGSEPSMVIQLVNKFDQAN
ncbi:hypothetical protein [Lentilactobacillus buchneri]|uniref:Uncharacterized protein n=2 Tax=Lentilactobacillus buchneri TaxID=1581 RepID=J9W054_LENBU|nr:hypothetical protein [Lentilactobacillus buchneri]WCJ51538.1 hypothetical protein OKF32_10105 [Lentilactobacillus sp. Egmn17]AEB73080.1 hypothetical protein Lbuc_0818 [Lentilactobacillus buchneri NRRL B-30929]AFR99927.1 hypothetical protein LBUCD034_0879 [Lentilactobacillus buchneri subsp. silagei CD034]MCT2883355.1 hypothetical protein [Lentilactobacillus buchneri]MCT2898334.1 hypothetical protein [Lentilactobacillus buchneri]